MYPVLFGFIWHLSLPTLHLSACVTSLKWARHESSQALDYSQKGPLSLYLWERRKQQGMVEQINALHAALQWNKIFTHLNNKKKSKIVMWRSVSILWQVATNKSMYEKHQDGNGEPVGVSRRPMLWNHISLSYPLICYSVFVCCCKLKTNDV